MSFDVICICIDARMKYIIRQRQGVSVIISNVIISVLFHLKKQRDEQESLTILRLVVLLVSLMLECIERSQGRVYCG
jgi:hypothetical protein